MITSYTELNDVYIDALKEIGNIGAGNAATSLGVLLDEDVWISSPSVRIEEFDDVVRSLGGSEEMCVAVLVNFSGEANGVVLFILSVEDAKDITGVLSPGDEHDGSGLSELGVSAVKELGNILGSSYVGSIASLTGMTIDLSIPHVAVDMAGAILALPVAEYGAVDSKVMFIEESLGTKERRFHSHVIMFTDIGTLSDILSRLEIYL
ncbi:MAG: chemotaxis protein CheC [Clostridiales Family XIII bacterium]|nr:chemotaxis protein CheC [Clostridiales Family XIII bacterium]